MKLYNNDDIQNMISDCKNNPDTDFAKKVLEHIQSDRDRAAISNVIHSGWYETFDRYDSDVCEQFIKSYNMEKAKSLWLEFSEVPVDNDDRILKPFHKFETGTDRIDIWHWFEEEYGISVAEDLIGMED